MKVLFLSLLDPREHPSVWSGIPLYMLRGLESLGHTVQVLPMARTSVYFYGAIKWRAYRWLAHRQYIIEQDPIDLWFNRRRMKKQLRDISFDMVFSWLPWHLNLVDTDKPKVFWYDTTFIKTQPLYFPDLLSSSLRNWLQADKRATRSAAAAIYPSQWARQSAITDYGADPRRVHAIPFGANFEAPPADQIHQAIERRLNRTDRQVRLLFVGVDWERKGGQTAVDVTRELKSRGIDARLIVVGCSPQLSTDDLGFVQIIGRLNKSNPAELAKLQTLYLDSDFFIMTSRAESYGIVYCEAMANGLPILATVTGGVGFIVRDDITGKIVEGGNDTAAQLAQFVARYWNDQDSYRSLAHLAFRTYCTEFDWKISWQRLGQVLDHMKGSK